jgi:hypothetical protein
MNGIWLLNKIGAWDSCCENMKTSVFKWSQTTCVLFYSLAGSHQRQSTGNIK